MKRTVVKTDPNGQLVLMHHAVSLTDAANAWRSLHNQIIRGDRGRLYTFEGHLSLCEARSRLGAV